MLVEKKNSRAYTEERKKNSAEQKETELKRHRHSEG